MGILADLDDIWAADREVKRKVAADALFFAKIALSECANKALKDESLGRNREECLELAQAIGDWETVLTAAAEILMQSGEPPEPAHSPLRVSLLAKVLEADKELERETHEEMMKR